MIQAKETYKEELSKHVEGIFKKYVKPGLHICDIATGGGKSYTIGKLTCEYYPKHFVNPEKPDVPLNKNDAFQKVQKRRVQEKR